jgi:hypothetical protein
MPHWLAWEKIVLHVPAIDKFARQDGTSSRAEFRYDPEADTYICIRAHKRANDPQKDREHEPKRTLLPRCDEPAGQTYSKTDEGDPDQVHPSAVRGCLGGNGGPAPELRERANGVDESRVKAGSAVLLPGL